MPLPTKRPVMRSIAVGGTALIVLCWISIPIAFGQQSGGTSSSGTRSTAGSVTTRSTGTSTSGTSTTSSANSAGNAAGTQTGTTAGSATSTLQNTNRAAQTFVGGNQNGNFVGGAREATTGTNMNRQFRGITDNTQPQQTQQQTGAPRQRPFAMRIGFPFPPVLTEAAQLNEINAASMTPFTSNRPELSSVNVVVSSDGSATLSGNVPDADARRLAANLVRLQPGVRRIRNEIAVTAPAPAQAGQ
ncbi:MAG: BON domain-containing protein [Planctomyces sp.]